MAEVPAHRQGDLARPAGATRSRAGRDRGAVGVGQQDRARVADAIRRRRRRASSASAGAMYAGVERAGHRQRTDPGAGRRLGGQLLQGVERAGGDDLAGAVAVGRGEAGASMRGDDLVRRRRRARRTCRSGRARRPRPSRRRGGPANATASARTTRRTPRRRSARRRCGRPTTPSRGRPARQRPGSSCRRPRASATSSGWVTAVSLISSASAVVPSRIRSSPETSESRRAARPPGQFQPRREHAGRLGALSGGEDGDHVSTVARRRAAGRERGARRSPRELCRDPTVSAACLVGQRPQQAWTSS